MAFPQTSWHGDCSFKGISTAFGAMTSDWQRGERHGESDDPGLDR